MGLVKPQVVYVNLHTNQMNPIASSTILANRLPSNGGNGSIFNASNSSIVLARFLFVVLNQEQRLKTNPIDSRHGAGFQMT